MYGFVILHYMAYEMTVQCVEYIQKLSLNRPVQIVIVDNGSTNGSGGKLIEKYKSFCNISVLLNHKNLGFAQGNNIGYLYLKANFNCDFIVVLNNDVLIECGDFFDKIELIFEESKFAVLGPDIFSPKMNKSQSPVYRNDVKNLEGRSLNDIQIMYDNLKKFNEHIMYYRGIGIIKRFLRLFIRRRMSNFCETCQEENFNPNEEYKNVVLHGACYIFSREFINQRKLCFNPDTFLYFEEDILHYECKEQNLKMLYSPSIKVKHLEDVSTDAVYNTSFKKTIFINKNLEKSVKVFLNLLKNSNKK